MMTKQRISLLLSLIIVNFPSHTDALQNVHQQRFSSASGSNLFWNPRRNNVVLYVGSTADDKRGRFSWLRNRSNNNIQKATINGDTAVTNEDESSSPLKIRKRVSSVLSMFRNSSNNGNDKQKNSELNGKVNDLENENDMLRDSIRKLQIENEKLHQQQLIVLETFEGESKLKEANLEWFEDITLAEDRITIGEGEILSEPMAALSYEDEECYDEELGGDTCPLEPTISFGEAFRDRAYWLVGLLIMQSASGVILARNEALISNHPVIVYFLTMLVGAGGNAGNQASVRVIRGLALGTLNERTQNQFLLREFKMSIALSAVISLAGFLRASVFRTPLPETLAVTVALSLIVFSSICLGAVLPLFLKWLGVDPAHSSTTIQVIMDILGVLLAVAVSGIILDGPIGGMLVTKLTGG